MKRAAAVAALALAGALRPLVAQTGASTGGVARLVQQERLAHNWRRVLMIGAHPDDEDTELLTILARGDGVETAYLSLTRGDGGQNLIGPELGEALGVLRTEELASARRIDGGEQFFTRAFDFGFSKTASETFQFWNRDSILKDMVRIIRRFRPQVVISVWSGTPADGHGHHQASGILAPEAFRAAGDAARFPELATQEGLAPWQPAKFYRVARGGGAGTLTFNGGVIDTAVGLSLHQIAAESRAQHRSQNQGSLEDLGPSRTSVRLEARASGLTGPDDSLFAGIPPEPTVRDPHGDEARLIEANVVLDATTDQEQVTRGESVPATLRVWNAGHDTVQVTPAVTPDAAFDVAGGTCPSTPATVLPSALFTCQVTLRVRDTAAYSSPYYLAAPRIGAMFRWTGNPAIWGEPEAPPLSAAFAVSLGAASRMTVSREVVARIRDQVIGEVRRPVMVVPRVTVDLEPDVVLWPRAVTSRSFTVSLEHLASDTGVATVSLVVPPGWRTSAPQRVRFSRVGERTVARFTVTAPVSAPSGEYRIAPRAVFGGDTLTQRVERIRYSHVRDENIVTTAEARVVTTDIRFPAVGTIGYVRGGGDRVPEALQNAGVSVSVLGDDSLERGDLARYHVIVIGPRAYEADSALDRANPRLMQWLADGGTLVIQYQQTPYVRGGFAPAPLEIVSPTQSRVTDETAPVTFLAPALAILQAPNRIGAADFNGWIQERGLDFPVSWDKRWTPVLEMHDPGDTPRDGGLLVAHIGRGAAVYTGLSFFRELPAAVPGAWRLFANILGAGAH